MEAGGPGSGSMLAVRLLATREAEGRRGGEEEGRAGSVVRLAPSSHQQIQHFNMNTGQDNTHYWQSGLDNQSGRPSSLMEDFPH